MSRLDRIIITAFCALMMSGCSLKEELKSDSTAENYYENAMQIRTGLNGCYTSARAVFTHSGFFQMTECAADLMYQDASTYYDANCDISPSRPGVASRVWGSSYEGVMRCNAIIAAIDSALQNAYITGSEARAFTAEAVVMRALYYYLLTSTFGDVPFYTVPVTESNRDSIARLPRMSATKTRDYLIAELNHHLLPKEEGGMESLPYERTYADISNPYAGAALGFMLAGKFCLWNERWQDAVEAFEKIEYIYGDFKPSPSSFGIVYPLTDVPFRNKYVKESIFEVGNNVEEYGMITSGSLAQFCMPKRSVVLPGEGNETEDANADASDYYDGIVIPELGKYARTTTSVLPTKYFYLNLMRYESDDLRSGEYSKNSDKARGGSGTLAWRWAGYGNEDADRDTLRVMWFDKIIPDAAVDTSYLTAMAVRTSIEKQYGKYQPWLGNKFWCYQMNNSLDSNNYKIFRYAGVLLNLAEAHLMSGNQALACKYLNIVRTRAGLGGELNMNSVAGDADALLEEIRMECGRELFGEFQRKFDLVRWGIWYERVKMYNDGRYIHDYVQPYHEYWPIPADQVTYSGNSLDNNAYKQ